jgi:hypothetical protein
MKQIRITRDGAGNVKFDPVSIDNTETVFFTNLDPDEAHWPTLTTNKLGEAPSPNSSQCPVPVPQVTNPNPPPQTKNQTPPYQVSYGCQLHQNEKGIIDVFAQLAAANTSLKANVGQPTNQQVVKGGKPPYSITDLFVNNNSVPGSSTKPGQTLPIAPGVQLSQDGKGIWVAGTPTKAGTFNFTFTVNDGMGRNLQQVQYSLTVS